MTYVAAIFAKNIEMGSHFWPSEHVASVSSITYVAATALPRSRPRLAFLGWQRQERRDL